MNYHALACELTSWVRSSTISVGTRPGSSSSKLTSKTAVGPALPILDTGDLIVAQVKVRVLHQIIDIGGGQSLKSVPQPRPHPTFVGQDGSCDPFVSGQFIHGETIPSTRSATYVEMDERGIYPPHRYFFSLDSGFTCARPSMWRANLPHSQSCGREEPRKSLKLVVEREGLEPSTPAL